MDQRLTLLWVNLQISGQSEHLVALQKYFDIIECGRDSRLNQYLVDPNYDVICFDFDYPDRASLRLVEDTKHQYPSIPMFIATVQHSEELAVWAFRSSMMDYLVKPLTNEELSRTYTVLLEICDAKQGHSKRIIRRPEQSLPRTAFHSFADPAASLQPALYYVEKNFDKKFKADTVANICGMSSFRFSRVFKETYGITFRDYVVRYRLREACKLLRTGHASVTEVAYAVGFNDVSYFSRMFKRHFSMNPSDLISDDSALTQYDEVTMALQLPLH